MIVYSPPDSATLTADITTEGWVPLSYLWELIEGTATIVSPTSLTTVVNFTTVGRYILKFTASAPEHGTFLETLDSNEFVTEYNELFAVQGAGGEGFSPAVSTSVYVTVYVLPAVVGSVPEPDVIGADCHILINGVEYGIGALDPTKGALVDSISENDDGREPNNASLTVRGFFPNDGETVIINLDSERIFGGYILRAVGEYDETWANRHDGVNVVDFSWRLTTRRITEAYANVAVSSILADIVDACPGFTLEYVQSDLGNTSICLDDNLAEALNKICDALADKQIQWKVDYFKRVYVGAVFPSIPAPDPLTFAHPTVDQVKVERELTHYISKVRVYGGEASVASNTPAGHKTILIDNPDSFGNFTDGGDIYISGIRNPETDDINKPDCLATSFGNLVTRDKPIFPDDIDLTDDDPTATASADCIAAEAAAEDNLLDELIRATNIHIDWRAIRVPNVAGLAAPVFYHYHSTYVTAKGETAWKQWFQTATTMLWEGVLPVIPAGGTVYEDQLASMATNAIEFRASNIPPFIQRINMYRSLPGGKNALVGSITGKGQFGLLGSNAGPVDNYPIMVLNSGIPAGGTPLHNPPLYNLEFPGASAPVSGQPVLASYDVGVVIGRSSGTLVDSKSDAELLAEVNLLGMPTTDKPNPKCAQNADAPTDDPEKEYYLSDVSTPSGLSYQVPNGARVKRYIDVVNEDAQDFLADKFDDDGIVEGNPISGTFNSYSEMLDAGRQAISDQNQQGTRGLEWQSRDRKTHPGQIVAVDFGVHFQGEVRIKSVEITQFEMVTCTNGMKSYPLYTVSAEPKRVTIAKSPSSGTTGTGTALSVTNKNRWRYGVPKIYTGTIDAVRYPY